jgi:hypothetical protein
MASFRVASRRIAPPAIPCALLAAALAGCPGGLPPSLLTLQDKSVGVNETLEFDVAATDPDTDVLRFSMRDAPKGATLAEVGGRLAKFRWTPTPAQVGLHTLTFVASDGAIEDTETVSIRVSSAGVPRWVTDQPRFVVNPGDSVVKFALEVKDDDSAEVFFEYDPHPEAWGASVVENGKRVSFNWQPEAEQKRQAQWTFKVVAVDPDDNRAETVVSIVFRGGTSEECAASLALPVVEPEPIGPQSGPGDYVVKAKVTDADSALQYAVVLYSLVPEPQDGDWLNALLQPVGGDRFEGRIPRADLQPGEAVTITWQVCASDDDDPDGDRCDGWQCSERATFVAAAGLALCDACQPGQCATGACLSNGRGENFCGTDCGPDDRCPDDFYCETIELAEGPRKQCIPAGCRQGASNPLCSCAAGRPVAPGAGELVLNEILYDPSDTCPDGMTTCTTTEKLAVDVNGDGVRKRDESDEEFVELLNVSPTKYLQLQGVTISDSKQLRFTFPALVLAPRKSVLVFGGGDVTRFAGLGGSIAFAAGTTGLELTNTADTVTVKAGAVVLDTVQWTSTAAGTRQSLVRRVEGSPAEPMVGHASASGASGAKWSPGTHVCGSPYPLDPEACVAPVCTAANTNRDVEPASNARSSAPCLRQLPQTLGSSLAVNQANAADNDPRDLFSVEGVAGRWLHVRTAAGPAPAVQDTLVRLLARNGTVLADNDDDPWSAASLYSRLVFQFPSDGVYFVEVVPYVRDQTPVAGSYQLTAELTDTAPQRP